MNWPYVHMVINHFPIILSVMGASAAIVALLMHKRGLWIYAVASLTLAGITAYPVVFTGQRADKALEHSWFIRSGAIHHHEEAGEIALWVLLATGVVSAYAWWRVLQQQGTRGIPVWLRTVVVVLSLGSVAAVWYAALEGGKIIHSAPILEQPNAPPGYQQKGSGFVQDSLWEPIRKVFRMRGDTMDGYFRINLPRSDLHVRIGNDVLAPEFEFTSYVGFAPAGNGRVLVMGEVVLRSDEVFAAFSEARRQGIPVSALHNHLIGEEPRIMYMHIMAQGSPETLATQLLAIFRRTGTPLFAREEHKPPTTNWSAIDAILGPHTEAEEHIAEYEFRRNEQHSIGGVPVKSSGALETGSEVIFQDLGNGRFAMTGELYVLPGEVEPVVTELQSRGLNVTALHNHMINEQPVMYWIHWYTTGDGPTLARAVATALARMNSQQKSTGG